MRSLTLFILILAFTQCQAQKNFKPDLLKVEWETIENFHKGKNDFLGAFIITNQNSEPLPATGWSIFFNSPRRFKSFTGGAKVEQINGDFFRLYPTGEFKGLKKGETARFELVGGAWATNLTDVPVGVYLVWDRDKNTGVPLPNMTVRPSTQAKQLTRYATDKIPVMTPERVYDQNNVTTEIDAAKLPKIFPTPAKYQELPGTYQLTIVNISYDQPFEQEATYLSKEIVRFATEKTIVSMNNLPGAVIRLVKNDLPEEAYDLTVNTDGIKIAAGSRSGIFYGIQSLKSLFPPGTWKTESKGVEIPFVTVSDTPRFAHRAFMLDVARNFQTKEQVLKTLDLMALYKMNVFHFHFNDDEGWRLEIPGLPELTEVGARRGHGWKDSAWLHPSYGSGPTLTNHGTGFYTRNDYIEILKYANERHIKVIPEIETPGHARAAVSSMEYRYSKLMKQGNKAAAEEFRLYDPEDVSMYRSAQSWHRNVMNVAMPSIMRFLEKVTDELISMYKDAGAPLETIHFGGDEVPNGVWEKSPIAQELIRKDPKIKNVSDLWYYYFDKLSAMLEKKNLFLYGWEEIAMRKTRLDGKSIYIPNPDFTTRNFQVDVWNNVIGWGAEDLPYTLANAGYKVVLSPVTNMYLDLAYQKSFYEQGHYWGGYLDLDKPFRFIPFDYYRNSTHDINGNMVSKNFFDKKARLTEYGRENIVGIQGLLWAETLVTPQRMEYMMLPKLLAVAERAWAPDPAWATETDSTTAAKLYSHAWTEFINVIGKRELPRLDHYKGGFHYRIPTAGAKIINGKVHVNSQLPGFTIYYTTDGSEPTKKSKLYKEPITEKGTIKIALFNALGRAGRSIEVQNN